MPFECPQDTGANQARHPERFAVRGYGEDFRSVTEELDVYGYPLCPDTYAAAELTLQEVVFAGVPVVAFPYEGLSQLIVNKFTGFLVNLDSEYRDAIEYLFHNPDERQWIGRNAHEYAQFPESRIVPYLDTLPKHSAAST